jgi:hypothetical protein
MNLVQIQEHLKDLPMQAVMSYANGQNPQVPPYLALGEMNRRKQMEQKAAQPAQGTVKDNIEQQVGLMQLQKLRQGQMAQQMAQQGTQAPTIPEGTPEPAAQPEAEMAMAAGGVTSLPVHDMHFGSGGIIAFANPEGKQDVKDEAARELQEAQDRLNSFSNKTYKNLAERQKDTAAIEAAKSDVARAESKIASSQNTGMDTAPVGVMGRNMGVASLPLPAPSLAGSGSVSEAQATALAGPQAVVPPRVMQPPPAPAQTMRVNKPPTPPAPPVAPALTDVQKYQQGILAGTGMTAMPTEYAPPKQAPIGEDYMKYMTDREQKRREDELKFEDVQKAREKRDFFNSLIAGGEATRGQKGIGSLFGGTGRALGEAATAAEERRMAFDKTQQDLADNDAKTRFEIANLRRAEERGDTKAIYDSKVKIAELGHQRDQLQVQTANNMAQNASQELIARQNNLTQLEVARIHQVTAGMPGETQKIAAEYARIKAAKGEPAAEEYMRTIERTKFGNKGDIAAERLNVQRQGIAAKYPAYMGAVNTYATTQDPKKKADALATIRRIEEVEGIKSTEAPTIDTSQWGNLKVK